MRARSISAAWATRGNGQTRPGHEGGGRGPTARSGPARRQLPGIVRGLGGGVKAGTLFQFEKSMVPVSEPLVFDNRSG